MISRRDYWLLGAVALFVAGAAVSAGAHSRLMPVVPNSLLTFWVEVTVPLSAPLLVCLLLFLMALAARSGLDSGSLVPSKGELERLLQLKRRGTLLQGMQKKRESTGKRRGFFRTADRQGDDVGEAQVLAPEGVLDRLVRMKRHQA